LIESSFPHELEYFRQVEAVIAQKLDALLENKQHLRKEVISARSEMWNETRHLIRDFDDVVMLSMQDQVVAASEKEFEENEAEIRRLMKMQQSPYFGRVDFEEEDLGTCQIYIGIHSLKRDDSYDFYVVDWRAPVSSLYYNFDLGEGWYDALGTRYNVNITLKRQFKIENGQLLLVYDTDSTMYDEILGSILSQNTNHNLKVIISTIQKEQNTAIRCNTNRSCLIYGLAGSGKTSVGLHRLAYILYHNRNTIRAENILIISNNQIFSSYISTILPDLGEKPAKNVIFHDLLPDWIGPQYQIEDYYEHLKKFGQHPHSERVKWMKLKYSSAFLDACIRRFSSFAFRIPEIKYRHTVLFSQDLYREKWGSRPFTNFKAGYDAVWDRMRDAIEEYFSSHKREIQRDIEDRSQEFLPANAVEMLYQTALQKTISNATDQLISLNHLDPEYQLVDLLRTFLHDQGESEQEADRLSRSFQQGKLQYEDALLLLFLKIQMGSVAPSSKIRHIVIDESQDFSPLQLTILKLLFPKSSFTLLGDVFQTINSVTTIQNYDTYTQVFGDDLMQIRLDKCYRSSSEINALAFHLLEYENPTISETYSYFDRSGKRPQYIRCPDPISRLEPLLEQLRHYNTIAVVANTEQEAVRIYRQLSDHSDVQLIISPSDKLEQRLVIIPLLLAKGLEFDAVVLVNAFSVNHARPDFYRRVYLGCTRALHELYLLETEPLPPSVENCRPDLDFSE